jgi:hypothetical protein
MPLAGLYGSTAFSPSTATCGYASTGKTVVLYAPLPECGSEPDEYVFTTDGATAAQAGTINLFIKTINGAAPAVGAKVFLSVGKILKFGATYVRVAKGIDVSAVATPGTPVLISPAPALIGTTTDSIIHWATSKLAGTQSVGFNRADVTQENADLEDFYTGNVVLGTALTYPILMHQRELNTVWKRIIYPSIANPGIDVFAVIAKAGMPVVWGQFKITAPDAPGESRTKVMHNFTLSSQKNIGFPNQYPSEMAATDLALYNSILERAGLPTALTQFD